MNTQLVFTQCLFGHKGTARFAPSNILLDHIMKFHFHRFVPFLLFSVIRIIPHISNSFKPILIIWIRNIAWLNKWCPFQLQSWGPFLLPLQSFYLNQDCKMLLIFVLPSSLCCQLLFLSLVSQQSFIFVIFYHDDWFFSFLIIAFIFGVIIRLARTTILRSLTTGILEVGPIVTIKLFSIVSISFYYYLSLKQSMI